MSLAQQLIEREKELRTGYLDLGNCGLTELPDLSELELLGDLFVFDSLEVGRPPRMREVESPAALEREGLEKQEMLLVERLNAVRAALAKAIDANVKFKYKHDIAALEKEIAELRRKRGEANG